MNFEKLKIYRRGDEVKRFFLTLLVLIGGAVLFQGFQCSSIEFNTAKKDFTNGDFEKARVNFEKETQKNQTNVEAWLMLAETELNLGNLPKAQKALLNAKKHKTSKTPEDLFSLTEARVWSTAYRKGYEYLLRFSKEEIKTYIDSSVLYLEMAKEIRPENPDISRILGLALENGGKKEEAIAEYIRFTQIMKNNVDFAIEKALYIDQPIFESFQKIKQEEIKGQLPPQATTDGDTSYVMLFKNDKYVTLLSFLKPAGKPFPILKGWNVNMPESWSKEERYQYRELYTTPYAALAERYYDLKEYDKALENVKIISQIEPANEDVSRFIVAIYEAQGKSDEAFQEVKKMVDRFPKNPAYLQRYADFLFNNKKLDEAIQNYEKAIALDPSSPDVPVCYQNIAVCYKNKAAEIQSRQKELADRNQRPLDPKEYEPFLKKSEENFNKALTSEKSRNNFEIMAELADIYYVTEQENNLKEIVQRMENIEGSIEAKNKQKYYELLLTIYGRAERDYQDKEFFKGFQAKYDTVQKKLDELPKSEN